jgi:acetyltransferase-like isoleucine patch superfamily enzyme
VNAVRKIVEARSSIRWRQGSTLTNVLYRRAFAALGPGSNIMKPRTLRGLASVFVGDRFIAHSGAWIQCVDGEGPLRIGDDVLLGYDVQVHAYDAITIGDRVVVGSNTMINSGGYVDRFVAQGAGTINIGNDVFIGHNCTILGGVTIGDHVIVAAGAVVTRDLASGSIAGGVPAKLIGSRA